MDDRACAAVSAIWSSILSLPEIGPDDDFFELGGTSMDGNHMLAEVRKEVGVRVRVRDLLENPTLAEFTDRVHLLMDEGSPG
jgi:aryl carrier-like protein